MKFYKSFTRKARFGANGSKTDVPKSLLYSSIVSYESICIAFLMVGLNDIEVSAYDISNAYIFEYTCWGEDLVYCWGSLRNFEWGSDGGDPKKCSVWIEDKC